MRAALFCLPLYVLIALPAAAGLYVLAALPGTPAEMWADPPDPTNQTSISFHYYKPWHNVCVPQFEQATRNGSRVDVLWRVPGGGCPQGFVDWHAVAPLGLFEPGTYEVVPQVRGRAGTIIADVPFKLIVRDTSAPWTVAPLYASTRGGTDIVLSLKSCPDTPEDVRVSIDGKAVSARLDHCTITVTAPPRAVPGAADITITLDGQAFTSVAAFRYVDPEAAPDPAVAERVLVPILYSGPGAFGSQWVTEATIRTDEPFDWYRFRPCSTSQCGGPVGGASVASLMTMFGQRPEGLLLFFDRTPNGVSLASSIRETSRQQSWGAGIPIVRERDFRMGETSFSNATLDPRYRTTLRIYGVDGVLDSMSIHVRSASGHANLVVRPMSTCNSVPCNSDRPAYVSVDLTTAAASAGAGAVTVLMAPSIASPARRYWAFITVTHNETQAVTVITPGTIVTP